MKVQFEGFSLQTASEKKINFILYLNLTSHSQFTTVYIIFAHYVLLGYNYSFLHLNLCTLPVAPPMYYLL